LRTGGRERKCATVAEIIIGKRKKKNDGLDGHEGMLKKGEMESHRATKNILLLQTRDVCLSQEEGKGKRTMGKHSTVKNKRVVTEG